MCRKDKTSFLSLDIDDNPVRQNNVTVGGNFGLKVDFTAGNFFTWDIFTIANGKFYTFIIR